MINKKSVVAIILARDGSKRLPNKNIRLFVGKPLIAWSIEAAKKSKYIDRIIVSTDSEKIAVIAKEYGALVPFKRPSRLSSDKATSESAIAHALLSLKNKGYTYDYFIYLQPTSPLRTQVHIDEALEQFTRNSSAITLVSVAKIKKNPYWIQIMNKEGFLRPFLSKKDSQGEALYLPNGAIYIGKCKRFLTQKKLYTKKTIGYIMDEKVSVDIDDQTDFYIAEYFYSLKRGK